MVQSLQPSSGDSSCHNSATYLNWRCKKKYPMYRLGSILFWSWYHSRMGGIKRKKLKPDQREVRNLNIHAPFSPILSMRGVQAQAPNDLRRPARDGKAAGGRICHWDPQAVSASPLNLLHRAAALLRISLQLWSWMLMRVCVVFPFVALSKTIISTQLLLFPAHIWFKTNKHFY